jgi:hypothetical protein
MTGLIIADFGDIDACPEEAHVCLTRAYGLWCGFIHRVVGDDSIGLEFGFAEVNDGWFGIRTNVTIYSKQRILNCQPCERLTCPP